MWVLLSIYVLRCPTEMRNVLKFDVVMYCVSLPMQANCSHSINNLCDHVFNKLTRGISNHKRHPEFGTKLYDCPNIFLKIH